MYSRKKIPSNQRNWYGLLPWLFLLIAVPVVTFIWHEARSLEFSKKQNQFDQQLNASAYQFVNQITPFEQALFGVRGLFDASQLVQEKEFQYFVQKLFDEQFATGLSQIGFIKSVNPIQPRTYRKLEPKFQSELLSLRQDKLHAPVLYVANNGNVFSESKMKDAFAEPELKQALEASAKQNKAIFSPTVTQINEQDILSMILPIYEHRPSQSASKVPATVYGWVYVNVNMRQLFDAVFKRGELGNIRYSLYDGGEVKYENQAIDAHQSLFQSQHKISLFGKVWVLKAHSLAGFERSLDYAFSNKVGLAALVIAMALMSALGLLVARVRTFDMLKDVNQQLRLSDERWQFALEGSESGVWDWNIVRNKIEYSSRWRQMFGYEGVELECTREEWQRLLYPDDRKRVIRVLNAYLQGDYPSYSLEYRFRSKTGDWKWVLSKGMIVSRSPEGLPERMVGTTADITAQKNAEEKIWQHANFDHLTNLPNRKMLCERMDREIIQAQNQDRQFALLYFDLDGFKDVNEALGHDQGDLLLQQAAVRLNACTDKWTVVSRVGGDEFVLLMPGLEEGDNESVERVAQAVLSSMASAFELQGEPVFVTASIGIGIFPTDAKSVEGMMQCVDQAMYASKHRGGNCFTYFTSQMQEKALTRMRLATDLRTALQKEQLFVQYQPIVELASGDIYKAEALIRWQHHEKGLISPLEFIPIAEETKLINEIGGWVFMQAIEQCSRWREQHDKRFQVAVNKSPVQFMNADPEHSAWLQQLPQQASETMPVVVEITESLLLDNTGNVAEKLQEYRSKGIKIALDDFGTGYSALSYLRMFEIDYLKIDRTFVANMVSSEQDRLLCKAIIEMAHGLNLKVVAEGIETDEQRIMLLEAGCDYGQGYFFSKPLNASDLDAYLAKQFKETKQTKTKRARDIVNA